MAARLFYLPFRPALDANTKTIPGAQAWFTLEGTNTPTPVYSDAGLTTPRANPVVASAIGRWPTVYMDDSVNTRVRIYDEDAVVGVDSPIEDYDPYIPIEGQFAANAVDIDDLADESGVDALGADMVGWLPSGTGAVGRSVRDKLRDFVTIKDFGAVGDGTTDDTAEIQAALDSLGTAGGTVFVPNGMTPLVDSNLNIPDNCALVGLKATRPRTFGAPNFNLYKPRIILNRTATITLNNASELRNVAIIPKNFAFSDTRANVDAWTGTAVTLGDNKSDMVVEDCTIYGFLTGISTGNNTRVDRPHIHRCNFDCVNGIYLKNAMDVAYVSECHGWPYTTLESTPEANNEHLKRAGAFIQLDGTTNDWAKLTDCFNYGWEVGYRITSADAVSLVNCSSDGDPGTADGSIGFLLEGNALEIRMIGCQAAAKETGIRIATTDPNGRVYIVNTTVWETATDAIRIVNGDVNLVNCGLRNTGGAGNGIYAENTTTKLRTAFCKFNGYDIAIKTDSAGVVVMHHGCDFVGNTTAINNPYSPAIASAEPLPLDGMGEFFSVAGTTNFATMSNAKLYAGRRVTLKFAGALFVGTGGNMKLAGGASFNTSADDTITFGCDGTTFYEISRSVNA